ncbi:hypothetical protein CSOJ01_07405 [Colletotrichum sojae]|uniref:Uncharacterized protein n=1 Tax=Colletotrichum sojae TaxID=2175907 RepID=A0A8H6J8V1_9PEZI|nr:hypothetical protein CSOJ01_07405 [Colletotrichum sojae]
MCGCKRRRAARTAWLEQRAAGDGGGCKRGFGPGSGPSSRPPFMGGPFGRWRATPRNDAAEDPAQREQLPPTDAPASRDNEKAAISEHRPTRVSFMSGPFSGRREPTQSGDGMNIKRESSITLPPGYTSGVTGTPSDYGKKLGLRESLPPTYDAAMRQ